ncbi:PAS domain-containing hybrid sensor histidine kinase/response regulator [Desulfocicer niacini]
MNTLVLGLVGISKDAFANWQVLKTNGMPYAVGNLPLVRAITKGESVREDFIVRHQDGSNRICDASAYPIYENGTIIGGMVIFLDITERIQAEEELNRIFELSPDLIGVGNLTEGYYKRVNPAYEISGRPLEEFLSRPYMDFIHPDDHNATANVIGVMQSGKAISGFINRYRCKNGSYRNIEWRATSTQEDGTVHVAGRDITDRLKAEKNLKESEEKYRELFNSIRDAILVTDINRSIIDCNPAFTELFGYSIDEIKRKKTLFIYENEKQFQELGKSLQKRYGQSPFLKTVNYRKKNGEAFSGETGVFFLKDQEGEITGFIGLIRDVTERKKLELQVRQAQKMESIGTLAGGIAHEFNNMLAIIIGNNELIMEEVSQSSLAKESAEEIRIAGLRARDVVKQLLTFSRQDDTIQKLMDLKLVVEESMRLIRSSTPANIRIEQHLLLGTCPVLGNETQINQLLINLCNNAVDVLPEKGGIITIELLNEIVENWQTKHQVKLRPGKYAKLKVSDNGFGMDNDILDRIFDPYFTTKDIGKGTGIGMAIVHGIVEKHGGAITVDSSPGRGSTFTIFLPVHDGLTAQNIDEQNMLPVGGEHILYVDDEPAIAKLGKRLLESLGYITESICDPEEAFDMVRSDPYKFDLLVTDMAMPNMTGDQLVAEILKIRQDMPTIICTGYSAKISEKEATDIGVQSFVMKPINKSELAKTVRKVLDDAKNSNLAGQ